MPTQTSNFGYNKPLVNNATDADLWGAQLNTNFDNLDADLPKTTASKTANFSVAATEFNYTYLIDSSSGAVTATLPAAADVFNGFTVRFKAVDVTNTITIDGSGSETIDGSTTTILESKNDGIELVCDGTNWRIVQPIRQYITTVYFTSSGTFTKANYPNGRLAKVICTGGGGGGGGAPTGLNNTSGGCGSAGGTAIKNILFTALGASETVTVGTGGPGGAANTAGTVGVTSSFGAHCSATGGAGGSATLSGSNGAAGVGSGGDLNLSGGRGSGPTSSVSNITIPAGLGGSSYWGGGGGMDANAAGQTALCPGAGGGGGCRESGGTANIGGDGAPGLIVVEIYG